MCSCLGKPVLLIRRNGFIDKEHHYNPLIVVLFDYYSKIFLFKGTFAITFAFVVFGGSKIRNTQTTVFKVLFLGVKSFNIYHSVAF